jgi:SAM-dependent methyltransferase
VWVSKRDSAHTHYARCERNVSLGTVLVAGGAFFEVNALFGRHGNFSDDPWHHAEVEYILGQGHHTAADRILDVDCERGGRIWAFADRGFEHVTGLDPAFDNLQPARVTATEKAPRATFVQGSPLHYPFPDSSFEEVLILSGRFGGGLAADIALLRESLRVLAPCGTLWFSTADGNWARDPLDSQITARYRSPEYGNFDRVTHVTDAQRDAVTEQGLTERLYGPCELTDVLYDLGFRAVSYRAHEFGFAATRHGSAKKPPRLLVRCRAPRPS